MLRRMLLAATLAAIASIGTAQAAIEHYAAPAADEVRAQALAWVAEQGVADKTVVESVEGLWNFEGQTPSSRQVFERTIQTFALVDADTRRFVEACTLANAPLLPPETEGIFAKPNEFYTNAMRQFFALYLAQRRMFDESLAQFAEIDPAKSLDPASYFYFKAVGEHQLLLKTEGLDSIATLLEGVENVPVRYEAVASLMKHELEALQLDTLDEVARKMSDVERQLELARAGQKVQKREDEIIATLDEIIEKLEQQGGS